MKITFFINTMSSGGAERQLAHLANFLVENGHIIEIITFGDKPDHYELSPKIKRTRIAPNKNKIIKLIQILRTFKCVKCDAIISFDQPNNLYSIPGFLFNKNKPKFIASERGLTIGRKSNIEKILFRFFYPKVNYIVSNSCSQNQHITCQAPKLFPKLRVINNYTDLTTFTPKEFHVSNTKLRLCVFARYQPQKNCINFAKAIKILKDRGYEFCIDWYGAKYKSNGMPYQYYQAFEEIIDNLQINDYINLYDSISNVNDKMKEYDGFCLPSTHEGFSNALSEAICCGLPVLAGDVSDNGYMVHPEENGYLFNPFDINDIANKIGEFLGLPYEKRITMGSKSRNIAEHLFSKERFVNSYLTLLNS